MDFYKESFEPLIKKASALNAGQGLLDFRERTVAAVKELSVRFASGVVKPQIVLDSQCDYYVARDILTNTVYICFRDLLVMDIDLDKLDGRFEEEDIVSHFASIAGHAFDIYKSRKGYHVFCVSHKYKYNEEETVQLQLENFSDYYYTVYSYVRGFCVRLNRKMDEYFSTGKHKLIYTFVRRVGHGIPLESQIKLVELHLELVKQFNDKTPSKQR
jgi:hypothetical protein